MSDGKTIGERSRKILEQNISGKVNGRQVKTVKKTKKNTLIEELSELISRLDALSVKSDSLIVQNGRIFDTYENPQGQAGE